MNVGQAVDKKPVITAAGDSLYIVDCVGFNSYNIDMCGKLPYTGTRGGYGNANCHTG